MEEWGKLLLKFYDKNTQLKDNDYMINYLSYWTGNGKIFFIIFEFDSLQENEKSSK
jgi:hypothetical protein